MKSITGAVILVLLSAGLLQSQSMSPLACGDGRVDLILDNFSAPWNYCCSANPSIPVPVQSIVPGCNGSALAVQYDLTNPASGDSWVVLIKSIPQTDLRSYTHLRIAMRGSNPDSHDSVDVKIKDSHGVLYAKNLVSITDLPDWRVIYIDLRELTGAGTIGLAEIVQLEIGIVRCRSCEVANNPTAPPPVESHAGTLFLDEFAFVDLKPGAGNRISEGAYETVTPNVAVLGGAAQSLLAQVSNSGAGSGMIPAWFPESTPNYNTYVQAEALLVFIYEYRRTGNSAYRTAANNLAAKLISLQIPAGKLQAGAWYTGRGTDGTNLTVPDRPIPPTQPPVKCDGDEAMINDPGTGMPTAANIDACEWVGNVGWALIALGRLQRAGFYPDAASLDQSITLGASWILGQPAFRNQPAFPGLISIGIEGNVSAYFGLLAAGKRVGAALLANAIFQFGWDPIERRLKAGARPEDFATALDVTAAWGVRLLQAMGKGQEALDSQGYAYSTLRAASFAASPYGSRIGFGDIAGPFTVTVEFAAQAAAAGIKDSNAVMTEIHQLVETGLYSGAFPGATDHWYGGPLPPWNTTMAGVSPTAWVYFANRVDPLSELLPRRRGQSTAQ